MRAILLAAGFGTRLRPLTEHIPKCLVEIAGQPLLDHWLDLLFGGCIERVLINTHHLASVVAAHVSKSRWRDRVDVVYEPCLLGTGGTVMAHRAWAGEQAVLVAHADNVTNFDLTQMAADHKSRAPGVIATMLAFRTDDPKSCGILEVDEDRRVRAFHEKVIDPPSDLANAAVYIFEPTVIDEIETLNKAIVDLSTEIIPLLLGRLIAVETASYHRDIGNPMALAKARSEFSVSYRPDTQL